MADSVEEVAFNEGLRSIAQQQHLLDDLRSRAGTLLGAGSIVTSFLGAQVFPAKHISLWVWPAVGLFVLLGACCVGTLWPREFEFSFKATMILSGWSVLDVTDAHRDLAGYLDDQYLLNQHRLEGTRLRRITVTAPSGDTKQIRAIGVFPLVRAGAVLLALDVLVWLVAIWKA